MYLHQEVWKDHIEKKPLKVGDIIDNSLVVAIYPDMVAVVSLSSESGNAYVEFGKIQVVWLQQTHWDVVSYNDSGSNPQVEAAKAVIKELDV